MFTGIIQGIARIISINKKPNFCTHIVELPNSMLDDLKIGGSISYNGCCLSITEIHNNRISFDLMKETLRITNLEELIPGDIVNVERPVKFNGEIGGHLMSGHISSTAKVTRILSSGNNFQIWLRLKDISLMKYLSYKGYIGIDGISLTIGEITTTCFCVYLIPETLKRTTIGVKKLKESVNIEIDPQTQVIVDTVERILQSRGFNQISY